MQTWRQTLGHMEGLRQAAQRYVIESTDASTEALVKACEQKLQDVELVLTLLEIDSRRQSVISRLRHGQDPTGDAAVILLSDRSLRRLETRAMEIRQASKRASNGEVS